MNMFYFGLVGTGEKEKLGSDDEGQEDIDSA